jgi:CCR4-NOT transcription complex subunit 7/8
LGCGFEGGGVHLRAKSLSNSPPRSARRPTTTHRKLTTHRPPHHNPQVLTAAPLPPLEADFFELLRIFFPALYDIKYLMKFCDNLHGGLNRLAETLDVARIGPQHQAGSDSLLTSATFLRLAATAFKGVEGMEAHRGVLYGLGSDGANELISAGD